MSDIFDLLIGPILLLGALILTFGLYAFIELWEGKDDDRKGKK